MNHRIQSSRFHSTCARARAFTSAAGQLAAGELWDQTGDEFARSAWSDRRRHLSCKLTSAPAANLRPHSLRAKFAGEQSLSRANYEKFAPQSSAKFAASSRAEPAGRQRRQCRGQCGNCESELCGRRPKCARRRWRPGRPAGGGTARRRRPPPATRVADSRRSPLAIANHLANITEDARAGPTGSELAAQWSRPKKRRSGGFAGSGRRRCEKRRGIARQSQFGARCNNSNCRTNDNNHRPAAIQRRPVRPKRARAPAGPKPDTT